MATITVFAVLLCTHVATIFFALLSLGAAQAQEPSPAPLRLRVVHLGDSYSSAVGARVLKNTDPPKWWDNNIDDPYYGPSECYRSRDSWGWQYYKWLEQQVTGIESVEYINRACMGGVIKHYHETRKTSITVKVFNSDFLPFIHEDKVINHVKEHKLCENRLMNQGADVVDWEYKKYHWSNAYHEVTCKVDLHSQKSTLDPSVDLVLMSFGGNDVDFGSAVQHCFLQDLFEYNPGCGPGCAAFCKKTLETASSMLFNKTIVRQRIKDMLMDIAERTERRAKVIYLGYPLLAKYDGWTRRVCENESVGTDGFGIWEECDAVYNYDVSGEVRKLGKLMDKEQQEAVDEVNEHLLKENGVTQFATFVSVQELFQGHEPDPSHYAINSDGWVNEILNGVELKNELIYVEMYHYNEKGHFAIANRLKERFGIEFFVDDDPSPGQFSNVDLVFVVDTSGSMEDDIAQVKASIYDIIDHLERHADSFRIGMVIFAGYMYNHPANTFERILDFTNDVSMIQAAIDSIIIGGTYEPTWSALIEAFAMPWRDGVKKVVMLFSDEPPDDPEYVTGYTMADVIAASLRVDPVAVYGIDVGGMVSTSHQEMVKVATETGAEVLVAPAADQVVEKIKEIISSVSLNPFAWLGASYGGIIRQEMTFDATGSYGIEGRDLVKFDWDVDNDGVYDASTTVPTFTHVYENPYEGLVKVRVTDNDGHWALATAYVGVFADTDGDGIPDSRDNCVNVANPDQSDADRNDIGDACEEEGSNPKVTILGEPYNGQVNSAIEVEASIGEQQNASVFATGWLSTHQNCTFENPRALHTSVNCSNPGEFMLKVYAALGNATAPGPVFFWDAFVNVSEAECNDNSARRHRRHRRPHQQKQQGCQSKKEKNRENHSDESSAPSKEPTGSEEPTKTKEKNKGKNRRHRRPRGPKELK